MDGKETPYSQIPSMTLQNQTINPVSHKAISIDYREFELTHICTNQGLNPITSIKT